MTSHAETFQGYLSDTLQRAESWMGILYYTKTDLSAARVSPHLWNNISFNSKRRSFGHAAEGWLQGALKWKDGLCFQNISPIRTTKPSACL
ncbi:hypothetical protein V8C40DRAFT_269208 [Trichoderma camerunense]